MARTRRTQRARRLRAAVPLITLAGYTNAGKSTLLNALTDAGVSVRDRLFETLDPTTRTFRFRDRDYVITDTVGFIRKLPHSLVDAFASTLEETSWPTSCSSSPTPVSSPTRSKRAQQTVADVLDMLGAPGAADARLQQGRPADPGKLARLRPLYPRPSSSPRPAARASTSCTIASPTSSTAPCGRYGCSFPTQPPPTCTACAASPATSAKRTRPTA